MSWASKSCFYFNNINKKKWLLDLFCITEWGKLTTWYGCSGENQTELLGCSNFQIEPNILQMKTQPNKSVWFDVIDFYGSTYTLIYNSNGIEIKNIYILLIKNNY